MKNLKEILNNITPGKIDGLKYVLYQYDYDSIANDLMKLEMERSKLSKYLDKDSLNLMDKLIEVYEENKKKRIKPSGYINPRLFEDSAFTNQDF